MQLPSIIHRRKSHGSPNEQPHKNADCDLDADHDHIEQANDSAAVHKANNGETI